MYLEQMQSISATRAQLRAFGGLNETYGCSEAEYESGQNFSSRDWPALSTRLPRRKLWEAEDLNGLHHLDGLLTVRGDTLEYRPDDPDQTTVLLAGELADGPKQMVSMGTKVLIWPDKKIFDTSKGTLEPMSAAWTQGESITFTPCDLDGVTYTPDGVGSSLPSSPELLPDRGGGHRGGLCPVGHRPSVRHLPNHPGGPCRRSGRGQGAHHSGG